MDTTNVLLLIVVVILLLWYFRSQQIASNNPFDAFYKAITQMDKQPGTGSTQPRTPSIDVTRNYQ